MIEHVVMWKFADVAEGASREENMQIAKNRLLALPAVIPEIKLMQVGRDVCHTAASYDMMLVTRFESMDDLNVYRVHPAHVAVADFIGKVTVARVALDAELDNAGELI